MDVQGLLDERNINLWEELIKVHDIEICKGKQIHYGVYTKGGKSIIDVNEDKLSPASFTHELLHIYLSTKDVHITAALKLSTWEKPVLCAIISDKLIEHIGNTLEHIKMLPLFTKMGYSLEDFISDFSINKLTLEDISRLKDNFSVDNDGVQTYSVTAIDFFIGKFFAAKACPNENFNYSTSLDSLKGIDKDLYLILSTFLEGWNNFDYRKDYFDGGEYNTAVFNFVRSLESWISARRIVHKL